MALKMKNEIAVMEEMMGMKDTVDRNQSCPETNVCRVSEFDSVPKSSSPVLMPLQL